MFKTNHKRIIVLETGACVEVHATFESDVIDDETRLKETIALMEELVDKLTPVFQVDSTFSVSLENSYKKGDWAIAYYTEYVKTPGVTESDREIISALVRDGALREEGAKYFVTSALSDAVMKKYKIKTGFFVQPKFRGLIFSVKGRRLTYNTLRHFIYYHCGE